MSSFPVVALMTSSAWSPTAQLTLKLGALPGCRASALLIPVGGAVGQSRQEPEIKGSATEDMASSGGRHLAGTICYEQQWDVVSAPTLPTWISPQPHLPRGSGTCTSIPAPTTQSSLFRDQWHPPSFTQIFPPMCDSKPLHPPVPQRPDSTGLGHIGRHAAETLGPAIPV